MVRAGVGGWIGQAGRGCWLCNPTVPPVVHGITGGRVGWRMWICWYFEMSRIYLNNYEHLLIFALLTHINYTNYNLNRWKMCVVA